MPYAAALSEHPDAAQATGEVIGAVLDRLGPSPDLVVVFGSASLAPQLDRVAAAVVELLAPGVCIGAATSGVVAGAREVEDQPALALFAARLPSPPTAVTIDVERAADAPDGRGWVLTGLEPDRVADAATLVLLVDPATVPVEALLDRLAEDHPHLVVVGGMASAGVGGRSARLVRGRTVQDRGAVGVLFPPDVDITPVVSQGCRPIGDPFTVTAAEGNHLQGLGGLPPAERLRRLVDGLPADERDLVRRGLHLGRVVDEHQLDFRRGDFLIRSVVGGDVATGALVIDEPVPVGATAQFQVRDAATAEEDLVALLAGHRATGALLFTCNGRGTRMFGRADHDAELVSDALGAPALAGMQCAGEIGPVGGRSFVHGFTASVVLFADRPGPAWAPATPH